MTDNNKHAACRCGLVNYRAILRKWRKSRVKGALSQQRVVLEYLERGSIPLTRHISNNKTKVWKIIQKQKS